MPNQSKTDTDDLSFPFRYELFMKAYNHVSERIDAVYKDLTRGKAAPMGGVAYLSLEDSEVRGGVSPSSSFHFGCRRD